MCSFSAPWRMQILQATSSIVLTNLAVVVSSTMFCASRARHRWPYVLTDLLGLPPGFLIGFVTERYTCSSCTAVPSHTPKHLAASGAIWGLTLGYWSAIISVVSVGATIYVAIAWWSVSELALAALDVLGILAMGLTIDDFGPFSDNACNIAEVSQMSEWIQERPGVLDAAGDAAATIDKDLVKGSAAQHTLFDVSASEPQ